jgi:hypothetical protein
MIRAGYFRFWEPQQKRISAEITFLCAAGVLGLRDIRPISAP